MTPARRFTRTALPLLLLATLLAADAPATAPALVEFSKPLPPPARGTLGTRDYAATDAERPFLARITEPPFNPWTGEVAATRPTTPTPPASAPAKAAPYTLVAQAGKYVGWFGIVRDNAWNDSTHQSTLLLQHLYFDGLMDTHLQVVSCFGAGDFHATANEKLDAIPKLALVRVYGTVALDAHGEPVIAAEHIRVWDWPLFTFMNYGEDHSNPQWVKLRKVNPDDIYSSRPTPAFYTERLGPRP
jgi:hypothetical protein